MAQQGWFESDEAFSERAKKEALEKSSGLSQGWFESDEAYEARASKEALRRTSGVSQGWFESDEAYEVRARKEALKATSGLSQGWFESDEAYEDRASKEALKRTSGVSQGFFEPDEAYEDRAMQSLADNPYGKRGYVYITHEAKRKADSETVDEPSDLETSYTPSPRSYSTKEANPILKGVGIGLLIDVGIFCVTLGGLLLDLMFGKQNYNFILMIPPIIGGILGAIGSSKEN